MRCRSWQAFLILSVIFISVPQKAEARIGSGGFRPFGFMRNFFPGVFGVRRALLARLSFTTPFLPNRPAASSPSAGTHTTRAANSLPNLQDESVQKFRGNDLDGPDPFASVDEPSAGDDRLQNRRSPRNLLNEFVREFGNGQPLTPDLIGNKDGLVRTGECLAQNGQGQLVSSLNHDLHIVNRRNQSNDVFLFGTEVGAKHQVPPGISPLFDNGVFRFSSEKFGTGAAEAKIFKANDGSSFILTRALTNTGLQQTCRYVLKDRRGIDNSDALALSNSNEVQFSRFQ